MNRQQRRRQAAMAKQNKFFAEYVQHLEQMETAVAQVDWGANEPTRGGRLTIEFGRRFYRTLIEWVDWAADQVRAGTLEPGGPIPRSDVGSGAAPSTSASSSVPAAG